MRAWAIKGPEPSGILFGYALGSSEPDAWGHFRELLVDRRVEDLKRDGYRAVRVRVVEEEEETQ